MTKMVNCTDVEVKFDVIVAESCSQHALYSMISPHHFWSRFEQNVYNVIVSLFKMILVQNSEMEGIYAA